MSILSERMLLLRKEQGLTQEHIVSELKIPLRSYRRYEQGEREPGIENLCKLADFYHVSVDYLIGRTDRDV